MLYVYDLVILVVVLIGFVSIVIVVEVIKLGVLYYLVKLLNIDDIEVVFDCIEGKIDIVVIECCVMIKMLEWECIYVMLV